MSLLIEYLGELDPRWGSPKEPCRVHAYLYLCARPVAAQDMIFACHREAEAARENPPSVVLDEPSTKWCRGDDPAFVSICKRRRLYGREHQAPLANKTQPLRLSL
jgi:hypothetical protein